MILYHGSTTVVRTIDLNYSQPNKDFGRGFYLSETEDQARALAMFKSSLFGLSPIANDRVGLQIRRLMEKKTDFDTFVRKLQYIKGITSQYYFGTQKAIDQLYYYE